MKTHMALSLCVMLLISSAYATIETGALTSTSTYTLTNILKSHTSAIACAGSAASSSGGGSASSTAASDAKAINVAASTCANAVTNAFSDAGAGCTNADATSFISAAAIACARATLTVRTAALASVTSTNKAAAVAKACSTAEAFAGAFAKAIATAVTSGFGNNLIACPTAASASGDVNIAAVAKVLAKGLASSYAYAASSGTGASKAVTTALFSADVSVYAQAIGKLVSYACASCKSYCGYCTQLPDGDDASSNTVAISAKGRLALASAFSDAVSAVCFKSLTVKAATDAFLSSVADVCTQITASARGFVTASGNSVSCTNSFVQGTTIGYSKAYGSLVADALAIAFKNDACATKAFASISAETFAQIQEEWVVKAFNKACVASSGAGYVSFSAASNTLLVQLSQTFSSAVSDAISGVDTVCQCSGAGYCCNCEQRSPACPY